MEQINTERLRQLAELHLDIASHENWSRDDRTRLLASLARRAASEIDELKAELKIALSRKVDNDVTPPEVGG